jgi:hypothetical protein
MQDTPKFIKRHKKIIGNFVEFFQEFLKQTGGAVNMQGDNEK